MRDQGRDANVRRGVWSDSIIVKSADKGNRGIMFASSACCATVRTTLALSEVMGISWLRGKPRISKEVGRGD